MGSNGSPVARPKRPAGVGDRRRPGRTPGGKRPERRAGGGWWQWPLLAIGLIALLAAVVIVIHTLQSGTSSGDAGTFHPYISKETRAFVAGAPINGVGCGPMEGQVQHIHQHLDVVIDGQVQDPPAYIGFMLTKHCLYWIHVHKDYPGVIHVEAPVKDSFNLGDYLDIWSVSPVDQTVLKTILTRNPDEVLLNGQPYGGDVRAIPLARHTMITLEYGSPRIPQQPFDFKLVD